MPRKKLATYLPSKDKLKKITLLRLLFGNRLFDPKLWYLNKNSISIGLGCGFFIGYLPIPMQMAVVTLLALFFRFNLPASLALVWISNPLTWVALYYPAYKVGAQLLGDQATPPVNLSVEWFMNHYPPLFLGCFIFGICGGVLCFITTQLVWRLHIIKRWQSRKSRKIQKKG
jgi:uncharacterized protein (DUF2062 family)